MCLLEIDHIKKISKSKHFLLRDSQELETVGELSFLKVWFSGMF